MEATTTTIADKAKLAVALGLVGCGIAGYYWLAQSNILLRILAVLAGMAAGAALSLTSAPGRDFVGFTREALVEGRKVVWPTRKETLQTTAAVFAFVVVMAVFLWLSDKTLEWLLYDLILGWKKS
jgi:preprotein translocase subunit SecE